MCRSRPTSLFRHALDLCIVVMKQSSVCRMVGNRQRSFGQKTKIIEIKTIIFEEGVQPVDAATAPCEAWAGASPEPRVSTSLFLDIPLRCPHLASTGLPSDGLTSLNIIYHDNTLTLPENRCHNLACRCEKRRGK